MTAKTTIKKMVAFVCMFGVVTITNTPLVYAYEAHVMGVTANIVDDSVTITPSGENFCDDGKLKVELTAALAGASIYYTTDGSEPVCAKNGSVYSGAFSLISSATVKAVSCHGGLQSQTMARKYNVSNDFCDKSSIKINKVYTNPDSAHRIGTCGNDCEWVELYNPTAKAIDIQNWKMCDGGACDVLSSSPLSIAAGGYAVVTDKASTWSYWNVPSTAVKIALGNAIGDGLSDGGDMLLIKDGTGKTVDQVNWGTIVTGWTNYNSNVFNPGVANPAQGKILGRIKNGYDTDTINDWTVFSLPQVNVTYPNGDETWVVGRPYTIKWTATGAKDSGYSIDIYYSKDSGATWGNIITGTNNDGEYTWTVPLAIETVARCSSCSLCSNLSTCYFTPSDTARIKVVATDYTTNFMISNFDQSDKDFCPPVDESLLTAEELALFQTMDKTGIDIISPSIFTASLGAVLSEIAGTEDAADNKADTGTETKSSEILNKDDEEYTLSESKEDDDTDKDKDENAGSKTMTGSAPEAETAKDETAVEADTDAASSVLKTAEDALEVEVPILGTETVLTTTEITIESSESKAVDSEETMTAASVVEEKITEKAAVEAAVESVIAPDADATIEFNLNA